jgi:hypothetical protein
VRTLLLRLLGCADVARLVDEVYRWRADCREHEAAAATLRRELSESRSDLERINRDLDETRAALRVAEAENLGAWKLIQRFHAQWDADVATIGRRMADAESDRRDAEALDDAA